MSALFQLSFSNLMHNRHFNHYFSYNVFVLHSCPSGYCQHPSLYQHLYSLNFLLPSRRNIPSLYIQVFIFHGSSASFFFVSNENSLIDCLTFEYTLSLFYTNSNKFSLFFFLNLSQSFNYYFLDSDINVSLHKS